MIGSRCHLFAAKLENLDKLHECMILIRDSYKSVMGLDGTYCSVVCYLSLSTIAKSVEIQRALILIWIYA
jgi:hypothetical protein